MGYDSSVNGTFFEIILISICCFSWFFAEKAEGLDGVDAFISVRPKLD